MSRLMLRRRSAFLAFIAAFACFGCSSGGGKTRNRAAILCLGDSQTFATTRGLTPEEYWPAQMQAMGEAEGYAMTAINEGHSNWTTADLLGIVADRVQKYAPRVVIVYAGVNDKGHGLTSEATQSNLQRILDIALDHGAEYVLILNTNYLNYSSGGDNASANAYYGNYATLRTFQLAAANYGVTKRGAGSVGYGDLFTHQMNLILNGTWTQGRWRDSQIADHDEHMNAKAQKATAVFAWGALKGVKSLLDAYKTP